ncbi:MAG: CDP-alcohol phosphatidyltransferase family protein [Gammaproteobacteria bacterium]|nr:CDP-alcohol phosphatidyltransferase family protein [Gammaproteobacteria bacterium]
MANLLTAIRLLLIIPVAWAIANPEFIPASILLLLILIAIVTDYFDGIVARATNTTSARGQLFDHGTDFLFVTSGLSGAAFADVVSPVLPALIIIAFSQYVLDSYFLFHQKRLRMGFLGRWNGIFYFVPLILIALSRMSLLAEIRQITEFAIGIVSLMLIISTIASIIDRGLASLRR